MIASILKPKSYEDILKELKKLSMNERFKKFVELLNNNTCNMEKANIILKSFKSINYINDRGETALIIACKRKGLIDIVKLLLDTKNCNLDIADKNDNTALTYACSNGYYDIVKLLLENGAKVNFGYKIQSPLCEAAGLRNINMVELLIQYGADVKYYNERFNYSPLTRALNGYSTEATKFLIERGARLDVKDRDGNTPLMLAIERGYTDIVNLILEKLKENKK